VFVCQIAWGTPLQGTYKGGYLHSFREEMRGFCGLIRPPAEILFSLLYSPEDVEKFCPKG
jgi:hypothetical protein